MNSWFTQLLAICCLLIWGLPGQAAIYRCIDPGGDVIFTQHRCGPGQQGETVNVGNSDVSRKPKPAVCMQVEKLADLMFPYIGKTESILDVYTDLGGREYLSAGITAAVNYVYNFRYNPKARKSNVLSLTRDKCLDGGFGFISEKDLPDWNKIKYVREKKSGKPKLTKEQLAERHRACRDYAAKLAQARSRLARATNKGQTMQARLDVEYYEGLQRDKCPQDKTR